MVIYRFEDLNGYGPYAYDARPAYKGMDEKQIELSNKLCKLHEYEITPMLLVVCGNTKQGYGLEDYFCGCKSLDIMFDWYSDYIERLYDCGYQLCRYTCEEEDCITEGGQVCFIMDKAEQEEVYTLEEVQNMAVPC